MLLHIHTNRVSFIQNVKGVLWVVDVVNEVRHQGEELSDLQRDQDRSGEGRQQGQIQPNFGLWDYKKPPLPGRSED